MSDPVTPEFRVLIESSSLGTPAAQAARATVSDDRARRIVELSEDAMPLLPKLVLEPIANGYRVRATGEYVIEVWKMLFNWRLVVMLPDQNVYVEHGYCYFGVGLGPFLRAVAAAQVWNDPLHTDPVGFDKKAF